MKRRLPHFLAAFALAALFAAPLALAADFYVATPANGGDDSNPGTSASPFATIGAAITAADAEIAGGDTSATIHVADGTYQEHSLVLANPIAIVGNSSDRTAVKIGVSVTGMTVFTLSAAGATLRDLTVQNGHANAQNGGNIRMTADGIVSNCVITSGSCNNQGGKGGNIYMMSGLVVDSTISGGKRVGVGTCEGANLYMTGGRVMRCRIDGGSNPVNSARNTAAAVMLVDGGTIENSLVRGQSCGDCVAVRLSGASRMVNCTVAGNTSKYGAVLLADASPVVVNSLMFGNGGTAVLEWGDAQGSRFLNCSSSVANAGGANWVTLPSDVPTEYFLDTTDYVPAGPTPLMNAGDGSAYLSYAVSATDFAGANRVSPANGVIDIGCYELDLSSLVLAGAVTSKASILVGNAVSFSGSAVGAVGTVTYEWDFGDGSANLVTTETSFARQFNTPGFFSTRVRCKDEDGEYGDWFALVQPVRVSAADLYVSDANGDDSNPGTMASPFKTVGFALNSLTNILSACATDVDGVTIHLADGTYSEVGLPTLSSRVTVSGNAADRAAVKIGKNTGRVFTISGAGARLEHLTVQNGRITGGNGGNVLMTAAGTISDCILSGGTLATTGALGGNLYATAGVAEDCEFVGGYGNNANTAMAASIYAEGSARITRCIIRGCAYTAGPSGGTAVQLASGAVMENCLVTGNTCTYLFRSESGSKMVNCSIVHNTPTTRSFYNVSGQVANSVVYGNGGNAAKEWYQSANSFVQCAFAASAEYSGTASTVLNLTDADFKDYANGDYTPAKDGALVNAGTRWADYLSYGAASKTDLAGAARLSGKFLDIGCYEIASVLGFTLIVR